MILPAFARKTAILLSQRLQEHHLEPRQIRHSRRDSPGVRGWCYPIIHDGGGQVQRAFAVATLQDNLRRVADVALRLCASALKIIPLWDGSENYANYLSFCSVCNLHLGESTSICQFVDNPPKTSSCYMFFAIFASFAAKPIIQLPNLGLSFCRVLIIVIAFQES